MALLRQVHGIVIQRQKKRIEFDGVAVFLKSKNVTFSA